MRKKTACPSCGPRDVSGNNLLLYEDSDTLGYCFQCQKTLSTEKAMPLQTKNKDDSLELAAIASLPFRALEDRNISKETCQRFGVRVALDEQTASEVTDHYYPYYLNGEIIGYKKRTLPKHFAVLGKVKSLFGQEQAKKNGRMLIVVEGEIDALSTWEILQQKGKAYNVVSLPNGANEAGQLDAATRSQLEFFTAHELVVICLDEDAPGQATAQALAELLVSQCKVKIMRLARKDTNEYLKASDIDGWWSALLGAKDYVPEAIENGSVDDLDELTTPTPPGVFVGCLPQTMKKMYGLRPGEITLILAPPGAGKTTLCRQITYDLLRKQDGPVFNMFLEEGKTKTRQGIVALHAGVALNHFRRDPKVAKRSAIEDANNNVLSKLEMLTNNKVLLNDEALLNKINFFAKAKGCKYGVLDHISYVLSSRDSKDERKEVDQLMTKLSQLVEDQGLHLIVVSHIKRKQRDRDKAGSQKYPYWEILSLDDARSSGAFEQLCHNVIALERQICDPSDASPKPLSRTRILKNREESTLGLGDYLMYNTQKGALEPVEAEY